MHVYISTIRSDGPVYKYVSTVHLWVNVTVFSCDDRIENIISA